MKEKNMEQEKSIRVMPEIHKLMYLRWKETGMTIRAQVKELVDNSRKYDKYREAKNA